MYALRERRVHVTQEDFELAVAKVSSSSLFFFFQIYSNKQYVLGYAKRFGEERFLEETLEVIEQFLFLLLLSSTGFIL